MQWFFKCAKIYYSATVHGHARITDNAEIYGEAEIYDYATVRSNTSVHIKAKVFGNATIYGNADIYGDSKVSSNKDYIVFKNFWSSGRYFTWTRSNNKWRVGCFYGTGKELIKKAYADNKKSGREYKRVVRYAESILADEQKDKQLT